MCVCTGVLLAGELWFLVQPPAVPFVVDAIRQAVWMLWRSCTAAMSLSGLAGLCLWTCYDNVSGLCVVGACLEATASSLCRPGSSCPRCSSIRSPVQLLSYLLEVARLLYQLVLFQHLKHRQCIHL